MFGTFFPGSAHNGYLDIANDLGWVGLAALLGFIATYLRQALQLLRIDGSQAILYVALLIQQAVTNLSESHWFSVQSVDFVIVTLATTSLARGLLQHRLLQVFGSPGAGLEPTTADGTRPGAAHALGTSGSG
jgi:exopolysaccharide production protein ExoQ